MNGFNFLNYIFFILKNELVKKKLILISNDIKSSLKLSSKSNVQKKLTLLISYSG